MTTTGDPPACVLGIFSASADTDARAEPPEPQGYRMDDYRAPTPATVAGGTALDTAAARRLWDDGGAVWIDVLAAPQRPANLPASAVWLPVPRRDIPGSLWLPDVGRGELAPNSKLISAPTSNGQQKDIATRPSFFIASPIAG